MKVIVAFIQPLMAQKVVSALHELKELSGATFSEVRGFGRGRAAGTTGDMEEELLGTVPKVRIEAMVSEHFVDRVVRCIREAAHTGNRGDGKVYVFPLERAFRISTGEEGDGAV